MLESKRRELVEDIRAQAAHLAIGDGVPDPMDQVQIMTHRDEAGGNVQRFSQVLASVERALDAISEDCYGECVECGEAISLKRLESIPWASHCVRCQTRAEQRALLRPGDGLEAA